LEGFNASKKEKEEQKAKQDCTDFTKEKPLAKLEVKCDD